MVDARVGVNVVVNGVGVAVSLVGGGGGGGGLDGGHGLPHSDVCSVPKGLDGVTYMDKTKKRFFKKKRVWRCFFVL